MLGLMPASLAHNSQVIDMISKLNMSKPIPECRGHWINHRSYRLVVSRCNDIAAVSGLCTHLFGLSRVT